MAAVCRTLLANCDWLEIPDDRPPYSLEELRQQVKQHAEELGGEESGFYYGMVARYTYGDADNRTCRFDIARQPSGLWTACFHYDGETPFQNEDWLYLHEHAGRVPMLAIHDCADFAADKGMTVFTGGQTLDEWSQMAEIWFWLMEQYEIGNPPEEAVQHLKKLEAIMCQSDRGERSYDIFSRLLNDRIIMLSDQVNDATASLVVAQLLYLEGQDNEKDISLYINSPGGSITAGMAIYDTMQYIKCDVSTICIGMAASMGAFLLSSGAKGKRIALPNSEIMIHQPLISGGLSGQCTDIKIASDHLVRVRQKMNEILAENTGKPLEVIERDTERDNYMYAAEAKEYGLIDKVIAHR